MDRDKMEEQSEETLAEIRKVIEDRQSAEAEPFEKMIAKMQAEGETWREREALDQKKGDPDEEGNLLKFSYINGEVVILSERDEAMLESRRQLCMDFLTMVINRLLLISPLVYSDFNKCVVMEPGLQEESLRELEAEFPAVGVTEIDGKLAFTTLSLIATITEILCGDRLAFALDERIANRGKMYACEWYYKDSIPRQNFWNWIFPNRSKGPQEIG